MTNRIGKFTYDSTNVTTSWVKVLDSNERRKFAVITNASDEDMWLQNSNGAPTDAAGVGNYVAASGFSYVIDDDNLWTGEVWMIHAGTGNKAATTEEGE